MARSAAAALTTKAVRVGAARVVDPPAPSTRADISRSAGTRCTAARAAPARAATAQGASVRRASTRTTPADGTHATDGPGFELSRRPTVYLNGDDLCNEDGVYVTSFAAARAAGARRAAEAIRDTEETDARDKRSRDICDAARSRLPARSLGAANIAGTRCATALDVAEVPRTALIDEHTAAAFTSDEHALGPINVPAHVTLASNFEPETEGDDTLASVGEYGLDTVSAERMALLTCETTTVERAGPGTVASTTAEPAVAASVLAPDAYAALPVLAITADAFVLDVSTTTPALATAVVGPVLSMPQGDAAAGRSCHRAPLPRGTAAARRCRRRSRLPRHAFTTGRCCHQAPQQQQWQQQQLQQQWWQFQWQLQQQQCHHQWQLQQQWNREQRHQWQQQQQQLPRRAASLDLPPHRHTAATWRCRRSMQSMRSTVTAERGHGRTRPPQGAVTVGRNRRRKRSVQEPVRLDL
jgi:hypothetical protein